MLSETRKFEMLNKLVKADIIVTEMYIIFAPAATHLVDCSEKYIIQREYVL